MMIYRVCPTLDICKDVQANSRQEAIAKVNKEMEQLINWKKIYKKGYSDLNCDWTYITDQWEEEKTA